jgi:hypothetical protein
VIRSEILQCFILDYAQKVTDNGNGRPTSKVQLLAAAKEQCGECSSDELLDAIFNLGNSIADVFGYVSSPSQPEGFFTKVSFEQFRNSPKWRDFFENQADFRIKAEPAGRVRCEKLKEQLDKDLAEAAQPQVKRKSVGFNS